MLDNKTYRDEIKEFKSLSNQKKEIESRMDLIKEKVAKYLHEDKINEKIVELEDGEKWKANYQTTSRNSTDLVALMELVGPTKYHEIVTQKESTFLVIKKAGKEKKSKFVNEKPIDNEKNPQIPTGMMLS
ncbi:MAG: hypothetical protein WC188_02195 [Candidatus Caldatribacteriota bacterium]